MERDRTQLILSTFKELNTQYNNYHRRAALPPLAVNQVKVIFKDEPGEGSGVTRSFYTAIAEALLANEELPNLDSVQISILERSRTVDLMPRTVGNDLNPRFLKGALILTFFFIIIVSEEFLCIKTDT